MSVVSCEIIVGERITMNSIEDYRDYPAQSYLIILLQVFCQAPALPCANDIEVLLSPPKNKNKNPRENKPKTKS